MRGWVYYEGKNTRLLAHALVLNHSTDTTGFVVDACVMFKMVKPAVRIVYKGKAYYVRTWGQNGRLNQVEARCVESDDHLSKVCLLVDMLSPLGEVLKDG